MPLIILEEILSEYWYCLGLVLIYWVRTIPNKRIMRLFCETRPVIQKEYKKTFLLQLLMRRFGSLCCLPGCFSYRILFLDLIRFLSPELTSPSGCFLRLEVAEQKIRLAYLMPRLDGVDTPIIGNLERLRAELCVHLVSGIRHKRGHNGSEQMDQIQG